MAAGREHTRRKPHLFVRHIPRLRRYARALLHDRDAADDLVYDTLKRAGNRLYLWRPGRDRSAWLFSMLHEAFIDQSEKYMPVVVPDSRDLSGVVTKPTQSERLEIAQLENALQAVSAEEREVLLLVALEQMTYAEAAKALSIPIGTVMSRLSRARDRLRQLMSGAGRI